MADLFAKCREYTLIEDAKSVGLYPYFLPITETNGSEVVIEGKKRLMLGSNNYLGLTFHPKVREAAKAAVDKFGSSCSGSRFLNGTLALHEELEGRLAAFLRQPAAAVVTMQLETLKSRSGVVR